MMIAKTLRSCLASITIVLLGSCSLNVPPPDQYSDPDAIFDVSAGRALLSSCYLLYPHYEYEFSTLGNDFCLTSLSGKDVDQQNLYNWQDSKISDLAANVWLSYYNCIANCDALIDRKDGIAASTTEDEAEKAAIVAEAKTLKAMCYLELLRTYATPYDNNPDGDGIVLKSEFGFETNIRSSKRMCLEYINRLLSEAESGIKATQQRNGWLSLTAVEYIMADAVLYAGDYDSAAKYAEAVIAVADEELLGGQNYKRLWQAESFGGRIFAFNTNSTFYTEIQYSETEGDYFALNPELSAYSDSDVRAESNIYTMEIDGKERSLLGKYNRMNRNGTTISYINKMRYAGAYFIAAEAYARNGNESMARATLNKYLTIVGAETVTDEITGTALTDRILNEKFREFAGEGTNWADLKRCHKSIGRLNRWGTAVSATISADDYRWTFPIPSSEYKYNEGITQNEGWPLNR